MAELKPSWTVVIRDEISEEQVRKIVSLTARDMGASALWELTDATCFRFSKVEGWIIDGTISFHLWINQEIASSILTWMSSSDAPEAEDGARVRTGAERADLLRRLEPFLRDLEFIHSHSELHPIEVRSLETVIPPIAGRFDVDSNADSKVPIEVVIGAPTIVGPRWQANFQSLRRSQSKRFVRSSRKLGISATALDPRDYLLLVGERATAQLLLAMFASGPSYLPRWDETGYVNVTADSVRMRNRAFMADIFEEFLGKGRRSRRGS